MWSIEPQKCVGPFTFGTHFSEVAAHLTVSPRSFRHAPDSEEIMAYDSLHLKLDASGAIAGVSVFRPREVLLVGVQLLNRRISEVVEDLSKAGVPFSRIDVGYWHEAFEIVLVEYEGAVDGVEVRM